jgi:hypothetical protein
MFARITLAFIWMVFLLLMAAPASAQHNVFIMDETGRLDSAAIQDRARPLLNRGASVAIYMKETDEDLLSLLEADGLAEGAVLHDDLIVIYVALNPRVTTIIGGADWSGRLEHRGEYLRETTLHSHLDSRNYNRVITDILLRIEVALQNDEASDDTRIRWVVLGALCLGLIMGSLLQFSGIFK